MLAEINACIIVATYNNAGTLENILNRIISVDPAARIIVINDGSTDETDQILKNFEDTVWTIKNEVNRGKGFSLARGFREAIENGFDNVLTIDSDGQHYPEDIPSMIEKAQKHPGAMIMGSRNMNQEGVPGKSSFGNRFSNFWFKIETWISLPDTQTGFRLYPLAPLKKMRFYTKKFEFEIEVIVRLAWKGVPFESVPISVRYDDENRVSHFRPARDFFRISVLNSVLVLLALLYYYPKKLFSLNTLHLIRQEAIKPKESNLRKSLSLAFGCFMGIVPIWGFQLLVGIPLALLFRLNKVLFLVAANISIPPMIPFIIYGSLLMGQQFIEGEIDHSAILSFTMEDIGNNVKQYFVGAFILAVAAFFVVFIVSFILFKLFRKEPVSNR